MTFFIAEVSSNHSRDIDRALKFIDVASEIGCNAVKFQLFNTDYFINKKLNSSYFILCLLI